MLYTAHPELQTKKEHAAAAHHTRAQQPVAGHMATRREAAALALAATQQQETDTETAGSARGHGHEASAVGAAAAAVPRDALPRPYGAARRGKNLLLIDRYAHEDEGRV